MHLTNVTQLINKSEKAANVKKDSVKLIAVSKVQPISKVEAALKQGHRCFGENRVQEALEKWPKFKEEYNNIELHLIGELQTNKARQAFDLFDSIQSLDRIKLANSLSRLAQERGNCPLLFIQVNTGEEEQKAGIFPAEAEEFVAYCRDTIGLKIEGLMCIPPINEEPALHFSLLSGLAERLSLPNLSMGMSDDFETAIDFGATHVRIGSSIFGKREST